MLKDKFSKFFKNSRKEQDSLKAPIMDGFVNIKGYKVNDDGTKKLVYHDCGDNVVTDWMRHAIMLMLTGNAFLDKGQEAPALQPTQEGTNKNRENAEQFSLFNENNHDNEKNLDAYISNRCQYFWNKTDELPKKYSKSTINENDNIFAVFPTKILFGTGTEYSGWDVLQSENETANASWYTSILNTYGKDEETARKNFNKNIEMPCNVLSGSISKEVHSGNGLITKNRTVNGPDFSSNAVNTDKSMNRYYGVVGAVKTPYFSINDDNLLDETTTDSGRLLKPTYRGIGRPCFIYFKAPYGEGGAVKEGWDDETSDVYLSKDDSSKYLNKITFKVIMPAQSAATGTIGAYYPYNGYKLKQVGLYNDSRLVNDTEGSNDPYCYNNMECGTLLAIKNIMSLEKTAEMELVMTWTLTI